MKAGTSKALRRLGSATLIAAAFATFVTRANAGDEVIARIGSIEVKADELRGYIAALDPREQVALAHNQALLTQSVRQLLAAKLVLQEAVAKKWDQEPAVAVQIERARQSTIVETYLQAVAKPPNGYPTDTDLQNAYDANKTAFLEPRQFQLAQIFIAVARDADKPTQEAARKKLDDVQKKLKQKNAEFGTIAATDSNDQVAAKHGGEIGWVTEVQIAPELRKLVTGLAKGAIADPIQLDDGWHIVKLLDTKAATTRPLSEVRDALADQLRRERSAAERRAYLAKLLQENPPAINELALEKIVGEPDSK